MKRRRSAVFLDRDGTVITERGYLSDPRKIHFHSGAFAGLKRLQKNKFLLVVISNQSGVGRGYFTLKNLEDVNRRFRHLLRQQRIRISGIYFCPHLPNAGCSCRKPKPFLAKKAAREHGIDLKRSFVIGDQKRDMELAKNIGAKGVLVLTGAGRAARSHVIGLAHKITTDIESAARWIEREVK